MRRRDVFKGMMLPLAVILAVVLFGCEKVEQVENPIHQPVDQGVLIGANGWVVTAMEGNVVITIPAGALSAPASFTVEEVAIKSAGNYAVKTIVIEPIVDFNIPAQLALKYDGCLENGINVCEAQNILFYVWDNLTSFIQQSTPTLCSNCIVNKDCHSLCICICQTGVIATKAD
jgi:hypothetical protein